MSFSQLPRSTPAAQGVSAIGILAFLAAIEEESTGKDNQELHSFMILRHGYVITEGWWLPYAPEHPHMLCSLSKSFTSTAIGLAVAEGRLTVDDYVRSFFPEKLPEIISPNLAAMRVRHLLSMATGHAKDTISMVTRRDNQNWVTGWEDGDWVKGFLAVPVDYAPGTHFVYNSGATYMLSAIIQKVTGQKLLEYLQPRLFEPLAITVASWEACPRGIHTGGFGLSIKTEDIAKFGQLYLQQGLWNGRQILPRQWVEEATTSHIATEREEIDWKQGYGYQFWRCCHNSYRGDGALGQYCIVMPEQDAVIAITAAANDMQAVLNLVWKHLLPAMMNQPLTENTKVQRDLEAKISSLELMPQGQMSITSDKVSGKRYVLEPNNQDLNEVTLVFSEDVCSITFIDTGKEEQISCGSKKWLFGETMLPGLACRYAATGSWLNESTFVTIVRYIETPFWERITFSFKDDGLWLEFCPNFSYDDKERLPIKGRTSAHY